MVGRRSEYVIEIRSYIKNRLLGIECKGIFDKICSFYGQNEMPFSSFIRWFDTFKCGIISTEDAPHARWPKTAMSAKMLKWKK